MCFVARVAAAIYIRVAFPEGTAEEEAIELMREYAKANEQSCRIAYAGLLVIAASRGGNVDSWSLAPELEVHAGVVSLGEPGEVGVMRPR